MLMAPCHAENQWLSLMKPSRLSSSKLWRLNHQTLSNIGVNYEPDLDQNMVTASVSDELLIPPQFWRREWKYKKVQYRFSPPCWDGDDFGAPSYKLLSIVACYATPVISIQSQHFSANWAFHHLKSENRCPAAQHAQHAQHAEIIYHPTYMTRNLPSDVKLKLYVILCPCFPSFHNKLA